MQPGQPERVDYTFESAGMCKIFLACEPLTGQRQVKVTQRRTSQDWAHFIRELVDVQYPTAEKLVLVMDRYCWRNVQGARAAKREIRVVQRGVSVIQASRRTTLMAVAVITCWRWVLACPR